MGKMLGKIDLLGLNSLGQNPGLNPIWGVAIGGGVAGVTTMVARHSASSLAGKAEAVGLGAGLAVSAAMYAMKSTRHAAIGAVVGTFMATGFALIDKLLFGTVAIPAAAGAAGMGIPMARALGIPDIRMLGVPTISPTPHPAGNVPGVAGSQLAGAGFSAPPVSLLGPLSPQAAHLKGIGGPAVHGLSSAYGATLLGGGR